MCVFVYYRLCFDRVRSCHFSVTMTHTNTSTINQSLRCPTAATTNHRWHRSAVVLFDRLACTCPSVEHASNNGPAVTATHRRLRPDLLLLLLPASFTAENGEHTTSAPLMPASQSGARSKELLELLAACASYDSAVVDRRRRSTAWQPALMLQFLPAQSNETNRRRIKAHCSVGSCHQPKM